MGAQLDYLCGIYVMGWKLSNGVELYSDGQWYTGTDAEPHTECQDYEWNPSTCLDDAFIVLEQSAQGKGYSIYKFPEEKKPYDIELEIDKRCTDAATLPLAMCICALRACGIDEREISKAL